MPTHEVLRAQWIEFLQVFTGEHAGRLVSMGIDGRQPTKHDAVGVEARELPLREVTADLKDNESTVVISLGLSSDRLLRHSIQSVSHIRIVKTDNGSDSTLEVESLNGQTTTLNIAVPASPRE